MKSFCALLFILFVTLSIGAQNPDAVDSDPTQNSNSADAEQAETKPGKTINTTHGKITIPAEKLNPVKVPLVAAPPVIDGKLNDEIWKQAAVFKDFYQTSPGDNIEPSKPTEAYLAYDEKNLYIAFKAWDERDKIRATVAKRDNVTGEDNVRVWLDTFNDQRRAYILAFNPFGIQQDGIDTNGERPDYSVDIVMESKGVIEDWGYSVEVKIPFKSLRYAAGEGKFWGINFARNIDRLNDELDEWMPMSREISGKINQFGKISGLTEIKSERTLELVPSVTFSETGKPRASGGFVNQPIEQQYGLNLKYTITPNITLDAAINPDFAEIEADAPVVAANQRFPIFFGEKRPFFLEGADIFSSPIRVFYSRQIIDPDVAAKITGKVGRNSFGFLLASDNAPGNFSEEERNNPDTRRIFGELFDKNANIAVLRAKRDVGRESSVGVFGTAYVFPERRSFLGGFDGRFKLDDKTSFVFQAVGSMSRRCFFDPNFDPATDVFRADRNQEICQSSRQRGSSRENFYRNGNGLSYYAQYDYTDRNFGYVLEAEGSTRDYRAEVGFTRRTNTNSVSVGTRYSTDAKPNAPLIRFSTFNSVGFRYNFQGLSQGAYYNSNLNFTLQKNTTVGFRGGIGYDRLFEEEFGRSRTLTRPIGAFFGSPERSAVSGSAGFYVRSSPNKKLLVNANFSYSWNDFDFDFGAGSRFPRVSSAYLQYLNDSLTNPDLLAPPLDPGTGNGIDLGGFVQYKPTDPFTVSLNFNKSRLVRNDTGLVAFDTNIFSLRSTYQFTRFIFTRARLDYDTLSRNTAGQLLVGWNPSPGTAFYAGYNDSFIYPGFFRKERTFFIRMSYLFRKSF